MYNSGSMCDLVDYWCDYDSNFDTTWYGSISLEIVHKCSCEQWLSYVACSNLKTSSTVHMKGAMDY